MGTTGTITVATRRAYREGKEWEAKLQLKRQKTKVGDLTSMDSHRPQIDTKSLEKSLWQYNQPSLAMALGSTGGAYAPPDPPSRVTDCQSTRLTDC